MIYIDPPYNTGNDFVYNDDFRAESLEFREKSGNFDDEGNLLTDRMTLNTESNGRFHTDWLNMIYPRLKLARDLLSDDGVIFISIDDNEVENLKKICNEVFGEGNFVANLVWQSTPGSNTGDDIKTVTENILLYSKNKLECHFLNQEISDNEKYSNQDEYYEKRGGYVLNKLDRRMTGSHYSDALNYPIEMPDGTLLYPGNSNTKQEHWNWRWSSTKIKWGVENGFIVMKKGENSWSVYFKQYEKVNNEDNLIKRTLSYQNLLNIDGANSARGTREVMDIFEGKFFDYPKPLNLIKYIQSMILKDNDIILDFFSGSATTAHAVMQLNAEEKQSVELSIKNLDKNDPDYNSKLKALTKELSQVGNRKFIMVQLPENTDEKSEAYKAGYKNICEIGKERIRRAGAKIREEMLKQVQHDGAEVQHDTTKCHPELDSGSLGGVAGVSPAEGVATNEVGAQGETCPSNVARGTVNEHECAKFQDKTFPLKEKNCELDIGFRVLKLDSSNMEDVYFSPDEVFSNNLFMDNIKADRSGFDLLFATMLDLGIMLSSKIEVREIDGKNVYFVEGNYLVACFDKEITEETITKIAKEKPYYFVMRDSSAASDSVITNFDQIFETFSSETIRKVL